MNGKRVTGRFATLVLCVGLLLLSLTGGTYAHDVGLEVDGEATVIDGNVQPTPYSHMESYQEHQSIGIEMKQNGDAQVTVLFKRFNRNKNESEYKFSNTESEEYALFEQEVVAMLQALAADGSNKTGRDMAVTLDDTRHSYGPHTGQSLQFEFTWKNLGEVHDNGTIVVTEPFASDHDAFTEAHEDRAHLGFTSFTAPYGGSGEDEYRYTLEERGSSDGVAESSRTGIASISYKSEDSLSGAQFVMAPEKQQQTPTPTPPIQETETTQSSGLLVPLALGMLVILALLGVVLLSRRNRESAED